MIKFILTFLLLLSASINAGTKPIEIKVGGYVFEPFVMNKGNKWYGATIDIIKLLNESQKKYSFTFIPTSSHRRFKDLDKGEFDLMLFEDKLWGWGKNDVVQSKIFHHGGEVYITSNESQKRDQSYFNSLRGKKIVGVNGFHYGFANFNPHVSNIPSQYDLTYASNGISCINMVIKGRADIAVVSKSLISTFLKDNKDYESKILISKKLDQEYKHKALLKKGSIITIDEINNLLTKLSNSGELQKTLIKSGLIRSN